MVSDKWTEQGSGTTDALTYVPVAGTSDASFDTAVDGTHYLELLLRPQNTGIYILEGVPLPSADPSITWEFSFFWRELTESGDGQCTLAAGTPGLALSGVTGLGQGELPGSCSYIGAAGQDTGWVMWSRTFQLPNGYDPSQFFVQLSVSNIGDSQCIIGLDAVSVRRFEFQGN